MSQSNLNLLLLNATANTGSTGRIAEEIGLLAQTQGYEVRFAYGRRAVNSKLPLIKIGNKWDEIRHGLESRLLDAHGFASRKATKEFIKNLELWKPDIVNIHNLHGYYINVEILFEYLKKHQIPVVWTFHDCWSFTGHCSHFERYNCMKWQTECHHCPNQHGYPESWFLDNSRSNFRRKSEIFNGLNQMTIVTPSQWLANYVGKSFVKDYPLKLIYNGVDLDVFKPSQDIETVKKKYKIDDKPIVLGVADIWTKRRALDDFLKLNQLIYPKYQILLVGMREKEMIDLPEGIKAIPRTENVQELAALYSLASVFLNPTYIDNFPTTNIEALACGTPVITYRTGGSPEAVDEHTGFVVEKGDVKALEIAIESIVNKGKTAYSAACRERAEKLYNKDDRFDDYLKLFNEILER